MENSVFATNLRIAMRNKDEYHIDNGKRKRTKKYKMQDLANDIGYSLNTVNGWTKTNGSVPDFETMKKVANTLNVDVAYLIGEQKCQHNIDQTICDITELNETSAKVLSGLNGISADMMNELLNHKDFDRLILFAWDYTHSHNKKVTITNTLDDSKDLPLVNDAQREMMKYRVVDTFGKILDDIYDAHQEEATDAKLGSIIRKMINEIAPYTQYKDEDEVRQHLLKIISYWQDEIKDLRPDLLICKFTTEQILDNFDLIKEYLLSL